MYLRGICDLAYHPCIEWEFIKMKMPSERLTLSSLVSTYTIIEGPLINDTEGYKWL